MKEEKQILVVSKNGFMRRTPLNLYKIGEEVMNMVSNDRSGNIVESVFCSDDSEIFVTTKKGMGYRFNGFNIPIGSIGGVLGKKMIELKTKDDEIVFVSTSEVN